MEYAETFINLINSSPDVYIGNFDYKHSEITKLYSSLHKSFDRSKGMNLTETVTYQIRVDRKLIKKYNELSDENKGKLWKVVHCIGAFLELEQTRG